LRTELERERSERTALRAELERTRAYLKTWQDERDLAVQERDEAMAEAQAMRARLDTCQAEQLDKTNKLQAAQEALDTLQARLDATEAERLARVNDLEAALQEHDHAVERFRALQVRLDASQAERTAMQAELEACRTARAEAEARLEGYQDLAGPPSRAAALELDIQPGSEATSLAAEATLDMPAGATTGVPRAVPPSAAPAAVEPDNLTKIEGIGKKIAGLLNDAQILTFAQLAESPLDALREILHAAGPRFQMADPSTWAQQARLAAEGDWEGLQELQDRLVGGRLPGDLSEQE
jgi:predicted flap endonuclease-1-like 5' DNA nuclease